MGAKWLLVFLVLMLGFLVSAVRSRVSHADQVIQPHFIQASLVRPAVVLALCISILAMVLGAKTRIRAPYWVYVLAFLIILASYAIRLAGLRGTLDFMAVWLSLLASITLAALFAQIRRIGGTDVE